MVNNLIAIQSLMISYFHTIDFGYKYVKKKKKGKYATLPIA